MNVDEFRTILHQHPFQPFTIRMVDGRSFLVTHRDFVAISPAGRTVVVYQPNSSFSVLDMRLMSELDVGNGQTA